MSTPEQRAAAAAARQAAAEQRAQERHEQQMRDREQRNKDANAARDQRNDEGTTRVWKKQSKDLGETVENTTDAVIAAKELAEELGLGGFFGGGRREIVRDGSDHGYGSPQPGADRLGGKVYESGGQEPSPEDLYAFNLLVNKAQNIALTPDQQQWLNQQAGRGFTPGQYNIMVGDNFYEFTIPPDNNDGKISISDLQRHARQFANTPGLFPAAATLGDATLVPQPASYTPPASYTSPAEQAPSVNAGAAPLAASNELAGAPAAVTKAPGEPTSLLPAGADTPAKTSTLVETGSLGPVETDRGYADLTSIKNGSDDARHLQAAMELLGLTTGTVNHPKAQEAIAAGERNIPPIAELMDGTGLDAIVGNKTTASFEALLAANPSMDEKTLINKLLNAENAADLASLKTPEGVTRATVDVATPAPAVAEAPPAPAVSDKDAFIASLNAEIKGKDAALPVDPSTLPWGMSEATRAAQSSTFLNALTSAGFTSEAEQQTIALAADGNRSGIIEEQELAAFITKAKANEGGKVLGTNLEAIAPETGHFSVQSQLPHLKKDASKVATI